MIPAKPCSSIQLSVLMLETMRLFQLFPHQALHYKCHVLAGQHELETTLQMTSRIWKPISSAVTLLLGKEKEIVCPVQTETSVHQDTGMAFT